MKMIEDDPRKVMIRMVISIGALLICFFALLWLQREARRMQAQRDFEGNPLRTSWIEAQRKWVEDAPGERALWSGKVSRFVASASENIKAVELSEAIARLGQAGPRDSGATVYIGLSRIDGAQLPAFGEGSEWLLLVERDAEHRNVAVDARPMSSFQANQPAYK